MGRHSPPSPAMLSHVPPPRPGLRQASVLVQARVYLCSDCAVDIARQICMFLNAKDTSPPLRMESASCLNGHTVLGSGTVSLFPSCWIFGDFPVFPTMRVLCVCVCVCPIILKHIFPGNRIHTSKIFFKASQDSMSSLRYEIQQRQTLSCV